MKMLDTNLVWKSELKSVLDPVRDSAQNLVSFSVWTIVLTPVSNFVWGTIRNTFCNHIRHFITDES